MACQTCGINAPTTYVDFHQSIGAVVIRFRKNIKGDLCRKCVGKYFKEFTMTTLFLGWWGMISFVYTLFILPNNIIRYLLAVVRLGRANGEVNAWQGLK
jgi:hypothetical protein